MQFRTLKPVVRCTIDSVALYAACTVSSDCQTRPYLSIVIARELTTVNTLVHIAGCTPGENR